MSARLEPRLRSGDRNDVVAYQGVSGAFSERAAEILFDLNRADTGGLLACSTFDDVFTALFVGRAGIAVVPVHNSTAGPIEAVQSLLSRHPVRRIGKLRLHVEHCLIGTLNAEFESVRQVRSHPAALAQCQRFFDANPRFEQVEAFDTAGAVAQVVAAGDPVYAAIAGRIAADVYGGKILASRIQDDSDNVTTFWAVARA